MFTIVYGDAFNGLRLWGTFETQGDAVAFAECGPQDETWCVVSIDGVVDDDGDASSDCVANVETAAAALPCPKCGDTGSYESNGATHACDACGEMSTQEIYDEVTETAPAAEPGPVQAVSEVAPSLDDKVAMLASTVDALLQRVERMAEGFTVAMQRVQEQLGTPSEPKRAGKRERKPKAGPGDFNEQMATTARTPIKLTPK